MNKKQKRLAVLLLITMAIFVTFICSSCGSSINDFQPVIQGRFKDAKNVFYPSTDFKCSVVAIDKNGDVYYLRMNGFNEVVDDKLLFNVSQYQTK